MNKKEALTRCLRTAAWLLLAIIPFIAGIAAKEGAENGFETFIGWAAMAEAVAIVVLGVVLGRRKDGGEKSE